MQPAPPNVCITSVKRVSTSRLPSWLIPAAAILFALALTAANIILGNLNQDEGWYLLAALRTAAGQLPYRDFLFTQGPVMPVVYGWLSPLWASFGVLGGRILTATFGLGAAALAARTAALLVPDPRHRSSAALTTWLLCACAPVHSYFASIPKTYALASLFLTAGFWLLAVGGSVRTMLAGICLALAAGTRISLAPAPAIAALALIVNRDPRRGRRAWLLLVLSAAITLALTYGICWWRFGDQWQFAQSYHAARSGGGVLSWLSLRAGFVSRSLQAYPLAWLLAGAVLIRQRAAKPDQTSHLGWVVAAITALHALSPFPYDDYQTPVMPLLAIWVAVRWWRSGDTASDHRAEPSASADASAGDVGTASPSAACTAIMPYLFPAAVLLAAASPILMDWVVVRQDRFWFDLKARPDIMLLREAGCRVRALSPAGARLLTQDAYLAVEAGLDVPDGFEMGPFCIFPELSDEDARRFHVHNVNTMREEILHGEHPLAATSGYSFAVACPGTQRLAPDDAAALQQALEQAYEPLESYPDFGQGHTELRLWLRRARAEHSGGSD